MSVGLAFLVTTGRGKVLEGLSCYWRGIIILIPFPTKKEVCSSLKSGITQWNKRKERFCVDFAQVPLYSPVPFPCPEHLSSFPVCHWHCLVACCLWFGPLHWVLVKELQMSFSSCLSVAAFAYEYLLSDDQIPNPGAVTIRRPLWTPPAYCARGIVTPSAESDFSRKKGQSRAVW